MFTMDTKGEYWFRAATTRNAVAPAVGGLPAIISVVLPKLMVDLGAFDVTWIGDYSWFSAAVSATGDLRPAGAPQAEDRPAPDVVWPRTGRAVVDAAAPEHADPGHQPQHHRGR